MNEQTIEMQIHAKAQEALQSLNKLTSQLTGVEKKIDGVKTTIDKVSTTKAKNEMNNLNNSIEKASKSMEKFKSLFTFVGAKRLTKTALGWINEGIDYTEQLNLFNVVFDNVEKNGKTMYSNLGKEAIRYQNKLNEAFGTNKTQTLYMQGIYQSMGETVNIPEKYASIMSETSTKLTYDLASLFNKQETATAEAIRAGIFAGQTKPLRAYGIDVTQMSMQPILDSLGITDRTVKEMSQAEKEILRYLATLQQARNAMGDLANTIESPSNQLKVFRQQLVESKVAMSSLFIGGLANILPYANAFLMVVKEVSKAIADMFGIELKDYNTGIASQEGIYDGIEESADNASKAVKELKRQTFGWDEIHNINEDKDNGSGTGISGGIDQRLLDAIKGYDNGMDKVRMKASQIRDDIMKWLGFTKEIDPLTGEVSFKYQGIKKTLSNMWDSFKGLSTQGKILVGLGLVTGAVKLWNTGKKLNTTFGNTGLTKVTKSLISPMSSLFNWMKLGVQVNGNLTTGIKDGIQAWREQNILVTNADGSLNKWKATMNGAKVAVQGLITGALGLYTVYESMKNLSTEGANLVNVLGLVTGSLGTIASGVQIGSIFGTTGAVIGGVTGSILALISACQGYQTEVQKSASATKEALKPLDEYNASLKEQFDQIEKNYSQQSLMTGINEALVAELDNIVEANGRVKSGYEERANYIVSQLNSAYGLEIQIIDGVIQKYDEQKQKISEIIAKKKEEIATNLASEKYELAIKTQTEAYNNLAKAEGLHSLAQQEVKEYEEKLREDFEKTNETLLGKKYTFEEYLELMSKSDKNYKELIQSERETQASLYDSQNSYAETQEAILTYEGILTASANNDVEAIEYLTSKVLTNHDKQKTSYLNLAKEAKTSFDTQLKLAKEQGIEITDTVVSQAESRYMQVASILANEVKTVEDITPDYVQAWGFLAENSENTFLTYFKKLPQDVQTQVVDQMYDKGYNISQNLQNGISSINPTILINADTSSAEYRINGLMDRIREKNNTLLGILGINVKKDGGIYSNGSWKDIPQYANGGVPSHGSMFVAGEHGAEIVGHINGKTEVLNQSQIANAIYNAVASAMSQYSGQASEIDVHVHTDEGTVIDRIEQRTKQTGQFPFTIPSY